MHFFSAIMHSSHHSRPSERKWWGRERGMGCNKRSLAENQTRFLSFLLHILTKLSFTHMLDVEQYYHRTICLRQVCIANKGRHQHFEYAEVYHGWVACGYQGHHLNTKRKRFFLLSVSVFLHIQHWQVLQSGLLQTKQILMWAQSHL